MLFTSESVTEGQPGLNKFHNLETLPQNHPFKVYCLQYIEDNFHKISQREIARRLQIGKTTINQWSAKLGLFFKKHTANEKFFEKWTPEMAYAFGYILADGNIAWNPDKYYNSLTITAAEKDRKHLEKIRKLLQSTKPLLYGKTTKSFRLIIVSKKICQDLMKMGILPRKSLTIRFPEIPKEYLSHFTRGVVDGDGLVKYFRRPRSPYFEIRIVSGSIEFIRGLREAVRDAIGVNSSITKVKNCYFLRYSCKRGMIFANWIYQDTNLFLDRKFNQYEEALDAK